jgi:CheY-like chemotaxis protein
MTKADTEPDDAEANGRREFARALNDELDRIGYPPPPVRTNQIAEDLGFGRVQAFRVLRGDALPTMQSLLNLHRLGVSIDAVFEQVQGRRLDEVVVTVLGSRIRATPLAGNERSPFVLTQLDGETVVRSRRAADELQPGDIAVGGLRFGRAQPAVAVIEDEEKTLNVLCAELGQWFNVTPFPSEKALFKKPSSISAYDAVVLDWVLPEVDGRSVVEFIRSHSRAPIIVTTGHREEAAAISQVLTLPDIYYAAKPIGGEILRAMVAAAIQKSDQAHAPER